MCSAVWTEKTETLVEQLRALLPQLHYSHPIAEGKQKGVPLHSQMSVPESHALTGTHCHEREDEAHVFKVRVHKYTGHVCCMDLLSSAGEYR